MEHKHTNQIICPYCGHEDDESWNLEEEGETQKTCESCEKEFNVEKEVSITYSTSRIECENEKHNYQLESYFIKSREHISGKDWIELPEHKWEYIKIVVCDICDDKDFPRISKEEYEKSNINK